MLAGQDTVDESVGPPTATSAGGAGALGNSRMLTIATLVARFMNTLSCGSFGLLAHALVMQQQQPEYSTRHLMAAGEAKLAQSAPPHQRLMNGGSPNHAKNAVVTLEQEKQKVARVIQSWTIKSENARTQSLEFMKKGRQAEARKCLLRKKQIDLQIDRLNAQETKLDAMSINMEGLAHTTQNVQAIAAGAVAMRGMQKQLNVEEVNDLMDQTAELMTDISEINDAVARPFEATDPSLITDNDELDAELSRMMMAESAASLPPAVLSFPAVPGSTPASAAGNRLYDSAIIRSTSSGAAAATATASSAKPTSSISTHNAKRDQRALAELANALEN